MCAVAVSGDDSKQDPDREVTPEFITWAQSGRARRLSADIVRRRASPQQGRALEIIGHAIEYLVDSRLFITSRLDEHAELEAIQTLMRVSRAVFAECPEVMPLRRQLWHWIGKRLHRSV